MRKKIVLEDIKLEKLVHGGQCLAHITEANVSALASDSVRSRESQAKRIDNTSQRDSQDSKPDMNEKPADSAATQLSRSAGAGIIGKPLFVWGGLPGEIVNVRITKKRNSYLEGIVEDVIKPSTDRIEPEEPLSYLSTSPWQIMSYETESNAKQSILKETFDHEGVKRMEWSDFVWKGKEQPEDAIYSQLPRDEKNLGLSHEVAFGYRNKMEMGFWGDEDGLHLAHYVRGTHGKQKVQGSKLAPDCINEAARAVRDELNRLKIWGGDLKTILLRANQPPAPREIVRESDDDPSEAGSVFSERNIEKSTLSDEKLIESDRASAERGESSRGAGSEAVGALFIKKELDMSSFKLPKELKGLDIYFSHPKSPASVPTKKLYSLGDITLQDSIMGKNITYDVLSFFQVNVPIFEVALKDIARHVNGHTVDMYSGVGTIGVAVGAETLVESDENNIKYTKLNAGNAVNVVHASSETALEYIKTDKTIIVDPPRAGLHKAVVERILEVQPSKVIYLSCNPVTQARDVNMLTSRYSVTEARGYNFFPRTPHIESLIVLELK